MKFLEFCASWLNRTSGKTNTLEIASVPSAVKNWFWVPVCTFVTSWGIIGNASKSNNFAFDNCHNKRILVFNEPVFENSFYEPLKIVMGGSPYSAQAKYKSMMEIMRTPVLVLCNQSKFPNNSEWKDRIHRMKWQRPPDDGDMNLRLDPRFFVALLKKYNIVY